MTGRSDQGDGDSDHVSSPTEGGGGGGDPHYPTERERRGGGGKSYLPKQFTHMKRHIITFNTMYTVGPSSSN